MTSRQLNSLQWVSLWTTLTEGSTKSSMYKMPMRLFNSGIKALATSRLSFVVALGLMAIAALPGKASSQGGAPPVSRRAVTDSLIEACFVPTTGAVYLIKEPGLKAYCAAQRHIYLCLLYTSPSPRD